MRRLLTVLLIGALVVGFLDAVALAASKTKAGEREYSWTTSGWAADEDCSKEDETDQNTTLQSVCWQPPARIVYRFVVPLGARLRGFSIDYNDLGGNGCLVEDMWAAKVAPRIVKVVFRHYGSDGNIYACNIHFVTIRYRVPTA